MMLEFVLNGAKRKVEVRGDESFLDTLRERCGVTSLKSGCSPEGQCGCCLALVNGVPKTTCAMQPGYANGKHILTLEGLSEDERNEIAASFTAAAGLQCGFCIPGIALRAKAITDADPAPTREAIAQVVLGTPLTSARQQPHWPCGLQADFSDVMPQRSRSVSRNDSSGRTSRRWRVPFSTNSINIVMHAPRGQRALEGA